MEAWVYHSPPQAEFPCPHWYKALSPLGMLVNLLTNVSSRENRLFDGFYHTPRTPPTHAPESPVNMTAPHQLHVESSGAAGVDREVSGPRQRSNRQQETENVRNGDSLRPIRRSG
jgi:hypothetical protein